MKSVLVLGSTGMLGHQLLRTLHELGYPAEGAGRSNISAADDGRGGIEAVLRWRAPDVVVNCIGWVRQRPFNGDPAEAICVNAVFPHRLSSACKQLGIELVHISTDCIGDRDWYGASKMLGESIGYGVVVRTSFIGHELERKLGLLEWILAQQGTVQGYARVFWNGLTTNELAQTLGRLVLPHLDSLQGQVWNLCGPEITKLRLLEEINEVYGCALNIVPVDEPVCDRRLDGRAFVERFGYEAPSWPSMLQAMRDPLFVIQQEEVVR